jgi:transcriptional regulator with XRE-family HTH domain
MFKRMLGETIYRLRKEKGLSQAELGGLIGVSNKAVSKWETYEANPDITLLPLLASTLGVTTDELLTDIKAEKNSFKLTEIKYFGMEGVEINTPEEYEFISDKKTKKGLPYIHIHIGKCLSTITAKARGVIAIGNNSKGYISVGFLSSGIVSLGLFSWGLLAIGLFTIGAVTIGGIAFGAIAIGYVSFGAISIGYYALTGTYGYAVGKYKPTFLIDFILRL